MSQLEEIPTHPTDKPMWPIAALILGVVFTPALVAFAFTLLRP